MEDYIEFKNFSLTRLEAHSTVLIIDKLSGEENRHIFLPFEDNMANDLVDGLDKINLHIPIFARYYNVPNPDCDCCCIISDYRCDDNKFAQKLYDKYYDVISAYLAEDEEELKKYK